MQWFFIVGIYISVAVDAANAVVFYCAHNIIVFLQINAYQTQSIKKRTYERFMSTIENHCICCIDCSTAQTTRLLQFQTLRPYSHQPSKENAQHKATEAPDASTRPAPLVQRDTPAQHFSSTTRN